MIQTLSLRIDFQSQFADESVPVDPKILPEEVRIIPPNHTPVVLPQRLLGSITGDMLYPLVI